MKNEVAVFGGGCFWCTEAIFGRLKGVLTVESGYAGGDKDNPSYEEVTTGDTGHVEVVKLEFDPKVISYDDLLDIFWHVHDPTTLNKQGYDVGSQYASVIFYLNEKQKDQAERSLEKVNNSGEFKSKIVTKIESLDKFYNAESYHKDYFANNQDKPYCQLVVAPKLQKFLEKYGSKVKS